MQLARRNFLRLSAGICLASAFPVPNLSAYAEDSDELKIIPIEIPCGTQKPFKAVHVSDTHLCLVDERENERKRKLAENRQRYFTKGEKFFDLAMAYAQKKDALFLHTGDMIDFVSEKNLEAIQAKFQDTYSFASTGNHEFSQYVGEAKEDAAYKALSFDRVQKVYPHNITFCSRIINGVNFIAFDDVYYNVTAEQLACFKAEVEKGLPIIAMCHCPLYTPDLFENAMNHEGLRCAYLVGVPEEQMADYTPGDREQQKPDIPTLDFLAWLRKQPLLKAILCGHMHYNWSGPFSETATQYVVGGNFLGDTYEINFT